MWPLPFSLALIELPRLLVDQTLCGHALMSASNLATSPTRVLGIFLSVVNCAPPCECCKTPVLFQNTTPKPVSTVFGGQSSKEIQIGRDRFLARASAHPRGTGHRIVRGLINVGP